MHKVQEVVEIHQLAYKSGRIWSNLLKPRESVIRIQLEKRESDKMLVARISELRLLRRIKKLNIDFVHVNNNRQS